MEKGTKVALVCCSNGQPRENRELLCRLEQTLSRLGLVPVFGEYLYAGETVFCGTAKQRAESLMNFYRDPEIGAIFDLSGGDLANELLPYLDYDEIARSGKRFWGYSDLTTLLNAIYAKTGTPSVLYQVRNLVGAQARQQEADFAQTVFRESPALFSFRYEWVQGNGMQGTVIGGNIRCLLKLAGTPYWPDPTGKILLLESLGGGVPQMTSFLNQLQQMGVFDRVRGILLGTFTRMEEEQAVPTIRELVKRLAGPALPIAKTAEIGHGAGSKAVLIGGELCLP